MQLARDKVTGRHVAIRVGHVAKTPVPVMVRTNTFKGCVTFVCQFSNRRDELCINAPACFALHCIWMIRVVSISISKNVCRQLSQPYDSHWQLHTLDWSEMQTHVMSVA